MSLAARGGGKGPWPSPRSLGTYYLSLGFEIGVQFLLKIVSYRCSPAGSPTKMSQGNQHEHEPSLSSTVYLSPYGYSATNEG